MKCDFHAACKWLRWSVRNQLVAFMQRCTSKGTGRQGMGSFCTRVLCFNTMTSRPVTLLRDLTRALPIHGRPCGASTSYCRRMRRADNIVYYIHICIDNIRQYDIVQHDKQYICVYIYIHVEREREREREHTLAHDVTNAASCGASGRIRPRRLPFGRKE